MKTSDILFSLLILTHCLVACCPKSPDKERQMAGEQQDLYALARERMVRENLEGRDITDEAVLRAMATVPRHRFVPEQYRSQAYADHPLPIGEEQTISQPYIVALMTQWLQVGQGDTVLEVGTGSGYQAAVLAEIVDQVYTIEIRDSLAWRAATLLRQLGYDNTVVTAGDGYLGWQEHAPYDGIMVTAAADHVPQPLIDQLKDGGRIVMPVGNPSTFQELMLLEKRGNTVATQNITGVRFVPLIRGEDKPR